MATRRNIAPSAVSDGEERIITPARTATNSNTSPAVPTAVIVKLLAFTFAMVILPISSYFLTLNSVFKGNSTWAGITAAVVANVVLIGYIIAAVREDQGDQPVVPAGVTKKAE